MLEVLSLEQKSQYWMDNSAYDVLAFSQKSPDPLVSGASRSPKLEGREGIKSLHDLLPFSQLRKLRLGTLK